MPASSQPHQQRNIERLYYRWRGENRQQRKRGSIIIGSVTRVT